MKAAALALMIGSSSIPGSGGDVPEKGMATIPADCGRVVCVIPRTHFELLLKSHNELVDEVAALKNGKPCHGERSI